MKTLYTILLFVCSFNLIAQPTINSTNFPTAGTTVTQEDLDATPLQPGAGGANQTWNFSTAIPNGNTNVTQYISPIGTPYIANYAGADIAAKSPDGAGDFVYTYYNHTSSITELLGLGFLANGSPLLFSYTNPQTFLQYPVTYNSTMFDTHAASYSITQGGITITNYRSGTSSYVADGYGSVILPNGATANNLLRIVIKQHVTDSQVYVGTPVPAVVTTFNSTAYSWISSGQAYYNPFIISFDTVINQLGTTPSKMAYYQPATVQSVVEHTFGINNATVYPNPASDHVSIQLDNSVQGDAQLLIYDVTGKLVKQATTSMVKADRYEWMLALNDLQSGIYIGHVICNDKQWRVKINKH